MHPSIHPFIVTTLFPTTTPPIQPSPNPSDTPTNRPITTSVPTYNPITSLNPTSIPSMFPTNVPSSTPNTSPTYVPSDTPTLGPTLIPSINISYQPASSHFPSTYTTMTNTNLTIKLTNKPTLNPVNSQPTLHPSLTPTTTSIPSIQSSQQTTAITSTSTIFNASYSSPFSTNTTTTIAISMTNSSFIDVTSDGFEEYDPQGDIITLQSILESIWKHLKHVASKLDALSWIVVIIAMLFLLLGLVSFICNKWLHCCCYCVGIGCKVTDDNKPIYILLYGLQMIDFWTDIALTYQLLIHHQISHNMLGIVCVVILIIVYCTNVLVGCFLMKNKSSIVSDDHDNHDSRATFMSNWVSLNSIWHNLFVILSSSVYYSIIFVNSKLFGLDLFTFGLSNMQLFTLIKENNGNINNSKIANFLLKIHFVCNFIIENVGFFIIQVLLLQLHLFDNSNNLLQYWVLTWSFLTTIIMILIVVFICVEYIIVDRHCIFLSFRVLIKSNGNKYNSWKMGQFIGKRIQIANAITNGFGLIEFIGVAHDLVDIECPFMYRVTNGVVAKVFVKIQLPNERNVKTDFQLQKHLSKILTDKSKLCHIKQCLARGFEIFDSETISVQISTWYYMIN